MCAQLGVSQPIGVRTWLWTLTSIPGSSFGIKTCDQGCKSFLICHSGPSSLLLWFFVLFACLF